MDGKNAIINKIISDAEEKAKETEKAAREYAEGVIADAEEWVRNYSAARDESLKKEKEEIIARRRIVADLDVKKLILGAKQQTLDEIFAKANELVAGSDKKVYLSVVIKSLEENAEDGDEVVLSKDGVITENDILSSEIAKKKKLSVKKAVGDFNGGVYLVGKTCDKDLTFNGMIQAEKQKNLSKIAQEVFDK